MTIEHCTSTTAEKNFLTNVYKLLFMQWIDKWPSSMLESMKQSIAVIPNFITEDEEKRLMEEIEPHMKRLRYEDSHWDYAIHNYREREQKKWKPENEKIFQRIATTSFPEDALHLSYIHILDLHKNGYIKPHIDSVRYCGDVISGVSLLSDCVMRLTHKDEKQLIVDLHLIHRSLYKMTNIARYDFTHEVLPNNESYFNGMHVAKERRISLIRRDMPKKETALNIEWKPIDVCDKK